MLCFVHSKPHSTGRPAPSSLGPRTLKNLKLTCSRLEASADCRTEGDICRPALWKTTLVLQGLGPGLVAELECESTLEAKPTSTTRSRPAQSLDLRGSKLERKRKRRRLVEHLLLRGSQYDETLDGRVGKDSQSHYKQLTRAIFMVFVGGFWMPWQCVWTFSQGISSCNATWIKEGKERPFAELPWGAKRHLTLTVVLRNTLILCTFSDG